MSLDSDLFRSVLGRFASGVTVVTALDHEGRDHGMTVSAFASLSLEPPLILACIDRQASTHRVITTAEWIVVNVLSAEQEPLSRRFSYLDSAARFEGVGFSRSLHGAAILDDVLAFLECRIVQCLDGGDHTIVVAEVETADARDEKPLLYYRGGYAQLER
ncbi:MAG: flavin reductase family protein [Gemmatimonadetes bacterium]|nr:flavin reductase family protein [Gemmatimonadota bacterium]